MNEQEINTLRIWCKTMIDHPFPNQNEVHEVGFLKQLAKLALQQLETKVIHPPLRWHEDGRQKLMVQIDREWEGRAMRAGFTIGERK